MTAKNTGVRARFRDHLKAVEASTIQNKCDIDDLAGVTQDTIEDVMKVVLAGLKLTIKNTDEEIRRLKVRGDALTMDLASLEHSGEWRLHTACYHQFLRMPWWKRILHNRMNPCK